MSHIKVPSWLELITLRCALTRFDIFSFKPSEEQSFWKEQSLMVGFDIRHAFGTNIQDGLWQSFFYEKFFKYTLKRVDNSLQNLKGWEKSFWKREGRYVEKLELTSISRQDLELMMSWFPNLRHLTLKRCNTLLQSTNPPLPGLSKLQSLEIQEAHLLSEKAFTLIPHSIKNLIIGSAKSITNEFFDNLPLLKHLQALSLQNCHSLQLNHLCRLPPGLKELDISGSGKNIVPDACFYLPRSLEVLKMNRWSHFGDMELALLPPNLHTLEIEGWQVTDIGLETLRNMPLETLNIAHIACQDFSTPLRQLPRTLKRLNLSQNRLSAEDFASLEQHEALTELDVSYAQGFDAILDDYPITFSKNLQTLNLSYSGVLHKQSIHSLKNLKNLKSLSLSAISIENSDLEWLPGGLEALDLSLCSHITDVGLMLLGSLINLTSLHLDGCEQIRGFGLSRLAPTLKKLSLAGCHRLSGKSLVQLPQSLEELSLDSCELILLADIQVLPATLQVLSLARLPHIGNEAADFLSSLPLLNTVSLQGCPKITEVAIAKLVRRKFEGTIIINTDYVTKNSDIELHPPVSMLRKLTNFKARLIHKLKNQALR